MFIINHYYYSFPIGQNARRLTRSFTPTIAIRIQYNQIQSNNIQSDQGIVFAESLSGLKCTNTRAGRQNNWKDWVKRDKTQGPNNQNKSRRQSKRKKKDK